MDQGSLTPQGGLVDPLSPQGTSQVNSGPCGLPWCFKLIGEPYSGDCSCEEAVMGTQGKTTDNQKVMADITTDKYETTISVVAGTEMEHLPQRRRWDQRPVSPPSPPVTSPANAPPAVDPAPTPAPPVAGPVPAPGTRPKRKSTAEGGETQQQKNSKRSRWEAPTNTPMVPHAAALSRAGVAAATA